MIVKGSIIEQVKVIDGFDFIGEKFEVLSISDTTVSFKHDGLGRGVMSFSEMMEYFKEAEDEWSEWRNITSDRLWQYRTKGKATQVRYALDHSFKGYAKCLPEDEYDLQTGIQIAGLKAEIELLKQQIIDSQELLSYYKSI